MSHFTYHCQDCNKEFTEQRPASEIFSPLSTCPHCGSARVQELVASYTPRPVDKAPAPASRSRKAHMRQPRQPRRRNAF